MCFFGREGARRPKQRAYAGRPQLARLMKGISYEYLGGRHTRDLGRFWIQFSSLMAPKRALLDCGGTRSHGWHIGSANGTKVQLYWCRVGDSRVSMRIPLLFTFQLQETLL
jgi:hypothetical protein